MNATRATRECRPTKYSSVVTLATLLLTLISLAAWTPAAAAEAQAPARAGRLRGTVTLQNTGGPVHHAVILVVGLDRTTTTDDEGRFSIEEVPAGTYEVIAQRERLSAERQTVTVQPGATATLEFTLSLTGVREEITVTASAGSETTAFDAFNAVTSLDSVDIAEDMAGNIGELLENEPGVAKRGFGPGSSRPIIRGFDGDRVLIMQDGIRTGDLSSQSGDHGVSVDPGSLHRIEVVKGPATLLYGSNAIGGVVNTITPHEAHKDHPPAGVRGQATFDAGSANAQAGGNGSFQYGSGDLMLWGGGGARRSGDYDTPIGEILNSGTELANGRLGVAWFGERGSLSVGYQVEDGNYGVPFAGEFEGEEGEEKDGPDLGDGEEEVPLIDLDIRRQAVRIEGSLDRIPGAVGGLVESARLVVNYLDYTHEELETEGGEQEVGTVFDNETWVFRAEFDQVRRGRLSGQFGVWGQLRDFVSTGEEALAPPTTQDSLAAFAYEELGFDGFRLQFGGRLEHNGYDPEPRFVILDEEDDVDAEIFPGPPGVRDRSFTGFSGSAGVRVDVGDSSALVANLSRSYRAPALEELFNFGPHLGNLTFEIGNPELEREATVGLEVSLRHRTRRLEGELNVFYYSISDFVFPAFTGEVRDGLLVAEFLQGDARHAGLDGRVRVRVHEHAWVNANASFVDAELDATGESLPRIPPMQGALDLEIVEIPWSGLRIRPEIVWASEQDEVFRNETRTAGYVVANLNASYTVPQDHLVHIFSVKAYNLTDQLYRNHTSFIKELAPEIGRGVKFSYALQFF